MCDDDKLQILRPDAEGRKLLMHGLPRPKRGAVESGKLSAKHGARRLCVIYALRAYIPAPPGVHEHEPARVLDKICRHGQRHAPPLRRKKLLRR